MNTAFALSNYADKHGLFDMFQDLISAAVISKPDDIITFFINQLQNPKVPAFVILGPPSYNMKSLVEEISKVHNTVLISSSELLKNAITRGNSYGSQAKPYLERGQFVPDTIMTGLVLSRLRDPDVQSSGYILQGYPRTREQARAMQRVGIIPSKVPDSVVLETSAGLRFDPVTNKTYHVTFNPPPKEVEQRLTKKVTDSSMAVKTKLQLHNKNLNPLMSCFPTTLRKISYPNGFYMKENGLIDDVLKCLGEKCSTHAPREFRIVVSGLPGSGKTFVSEMLAEKFGFVHVSPKVVILEQLSAKSSKYAKVLGEFVHRPYEAPFELISKLIIEKLNSKECKNNGWVLDGYPQTPKEAQELENNDIQPNRVFWLQVDPEICVSRLVNRRYHELSGKVVNIKVDPYDGATDDLITSHQDSEFVVRRRMDMVGDLQENLKSTYGYKISEVSKGIMQDICADGIGEMGKHKNRVFEFLSGSLIRPIPITAPKRKLV